MTEYIEREQIDFGSCKQYVLINGTPYVNLDEIAIKLKSIPNADVAPVKHGKWIVKKLDDFRKFEVICSNCGWTGIENYDSYDEPSDFNYCPSCGAKMDLE